VSNSPSIANDDVAKTNAAIYKVARKYGVVVDAKTKALILGAIREGQVLGLAMGFPEGYIMGAEKAVEAAKQKRKGL
jgi:hypothetical protein